MLLRRSQNFEFLGLKNLLPGQFLWSPNSGRYHWILKLLIAIRGLGAKRCMAFLLFKFWKELWCFKVKESFWGHFLDLLFCPKGICNICGPAQCIVYWIRFQNIYTFTYQRTLLHTVFLLVIKIVKNRQCILKDLKPIGGVTDETFKRLFDAKKLLCPNFKKIISWMTKSKWNKNLRSLHNNYM